MLHIEGSDCESLSALDALDETNDSLWSFLPLFQECIEVFRLLKTIPAGKLKVVTGVVGHHQHGTGVKSFKKKGTFVVHRQVRGSPKDSHAALFAPGLCSVEQGFGHFVLLNAFKESKEANLLSMKAIVMIVDDCSDAANGFTILYRNEGLSLSVFEEWVLARVESKFDI